MANPDTTLIDGKPYCLISESGPMALWEPCPITAAASLPSHSGAGLGIALGIALVASWGGAAIGQRKTRYRALLIDANRSLEKC